MHIHQAKLTTEFRAEFTRAAAVGTKLYTAEGHHEAKNLGSWELSGSTVYALSLGDASRGTSTMGFSKPQSIAVLSKLTLLIPQTYLLFPPVHSRHDNSHSNICMNTPCFFSAGLN